MANLRKFLIMLAYLLFKVFLFYSIFYTLYKGGVEYTCSQRRPGDSVDKIEITDMTSLNITNFSSKYSKGYLLIPHDKKLNLYVSSGENVAVRSVFGNVTEHQYLKVESSFEKITLTQRVESSYRILNCRIQNGTEYNFMNTYNKTGFFWKMSIDVVGKTYSNEIKHYLLKKADNYFNLMLCELETRFETCDMKKSSQDNLFLTFLVISGLVTLYSFLTATSYRKYAFRRMALVLKNELKPLDFLNFCNPVTRAPVTKKKGDVIYVVGDFLGPQEDVQEMECIQTDEGEFKVIGNECLYRGKDKICQLISLKDSRKISEIKKYFYKLYLSPGNAAVKLGEHSHFLKTWDVCNRINEGQVVFPIEVEEETIIMDVDKINLDIIMKVRAIAYNTSVLLVEHNKRFFGELRMDVLVKSLQMGCLSNWCDLKNSQWKWYSSDFSKIMSERENLMVKCQCSWRKSDALVSSEYLLENNLIYVHEETKKVSDYVLSKINWVKSKNVLDDPTSVGPEKLVEAIKKKISYFKGVKERLSQVINSINIEMVPEEIKKKLVFETSVMNYINTHNINFNVNSFKSEFEDLMEHWENLNSNVEEGNKLLTEAEMEKLKECKELMANGLKNHCLLPIVKDLQDIEIFKMDLGKAIEIGRVRLKDFKNEGVLAINNYLNYKKALLEGKTETLFSTSKDSLMKYLELSRVIKLKDGCSDFKDKNEKKRLIKEYKKFDVKNVKEMRQNLLVSGSVVDLAGFNVRLKNGVGELIKDIKDCAGYLSAAEHCFEILSSSVDGIIMKEEFNLAGKLEEVEKEKKRSSKNSNLKKDSKKDNIKATVGNENTLYWEILNSSFKGNGGEEGKGKNSMGKSRKVPKKQGKKIRQTPLKEVEGLKIKRSNVCRDYSASFLTAVNLFKTIECSVGNKKWKISDFKLKDQSFNKDNIRVKTVFDFTKSLRSKTKGLKQIEEGGEFNSKPTEQLTGAEVLELIRQEFLGVSEMEQNMWVKPTTKSSVPKITFYDIEIV